MELYCQEKAVGNLRVKKKDSHEKIERKCRIIKIFSTSAHLIEQDRLCPL